MNSGKSTTHWRNWWVRLTQPTPDLPTNNEQQARLLASLSLTLLLLGLIVGPIWLIATTDLLQASVLVASMLGVLFLVYRLSLTLSYSQAASLLALSIPLLISIHLWTSSSDIAQRMMVLNGLVVAVMVAILFLRPRFVLLLTSFCLLIITIHFFVPAIPFIYPFAYLFFFIVLTGLAAVTHAVGQYYRREMADSQARYQSLFDQAHDAVFILNLKGEHIEANQRAADILGYTLTEINRLSMSHITAEPDQSEQVLERLLAGEHIPVYERHFRHKDGTIVPVEIKAELVRKATGQPTHIQSVVRDITDRKEKEQQLWLQSAALQAAANAIVIMNANGMIQWSNPAYSRLTQYTLEEIVGTNPRELVNSGIQDQNSYETLWNTILSGQVWHGTLINQRKDGSHYTEEQTITPLADAEGNITHLVAIKQDVTEREASVQALRQSEARQRALLNAIPDLMFLYKRDGTCLDYHASNPAELLLPPEQFLGRKVTEVLPDSLAQIHMAHTEQVLQTRQMSFYEYTLVINDEERYFESGMAPSGPDEVLAIVRDVTQLKIRQKQAVELAVEKERTKMLRQFVGSSSHELRTPLTIINTSLYLLQKVDDPIKRQRYVEQSQAQIGRLTHLLDMVVMMTKLDSGVPFTFVETDINNLLSQIIVGQPSEVRDRFHLTRDPSLPLCWVDVIWLQRGIRHILDNAVRFTLDDSPVWVRTRSSGGQVVIEIEDNGVGISNKHLFHLFERFWRLDKAHSKPGFGLGLSIAQKVVQTHNGCIEVESEVGQGSCFRILLPGGAKLNG